jgi:HEAT repeat protein
MRRSLVFTLLFLALVAVPVVAEEVTAQERTRQTLLYGIDAQVIDAIASIKASNDTGFTKELTAILGAQRSNDLQKAVLDLFRDQKVKEGESSAKAILAGWRDAQNDLVVSAVQYLAAIASNGLADVLVPLVDASDNGLAFAAIRALGTNGTSGSAQLLVKKLQSTDYPDARKNDIILALGSLKDATAVDALIAIAKSTDSDKVSRLYAADSLGRIGDAKALPVLRDMFAEKDALIRQYAAGAIERFNLDEAFPSIIQGLRDESVKVREQSAKSLAVKLSSSQASTAVPILSYKSELDPEPSVRLASIQALGTIGGNEAVQALLKIYAGPDHPVASREAALSALAQQDMPGGSLDAVRKVVADEWKSFDKRTLEATARALSTAKDGGGLKDIYVKLLQSPDPAVRSYGLRGIGVNGFSDLKEQVKQISEQDPDAGTRREAQVCLSKL